MQTQSVVVNSDLDYLPNFIFNTKELKILRFSLSAVEQKLIFIIKLVQPLLLILTLKKSFFFLFNLLTFQILPIPEILLTVYVSLAERKFQKKKKNL